MSIGNRPGVAVRALHARAAEPANRREMALKLLLRRTKFKFQKENGIHPKRFRGLIGEIVRRFPAIMDPRCPWS